MIAEKTINIEVFPSHKHPALYESMVEEIFGECDPVHVPGVTLVGSIGNKTIGMLSYYVRNRNAFCIQVAGIRPDYRSSPGAMVWLREVLNYLHNDVRYVMAEIVNTNSKALRMALKAGFIITGTRLSSQGRLLVELTHVKGGA